MPRAAAARSSRSRSSSGARSSIRLVLAGRWPGGLLLAKATPTRNVRTLYGVAPGEPTREKARPQRAQNHRYLG